MTDSRLNALLEENQRLRGRLRELGAEPGEKPGFTVELLGVPRVFRHEEAGGRFEIPWRLRRARRALAFLALAPGGRSTRDELVGVLWPDADATRVRRSLHPTLYVLRRDLGQPRPGTPAIRAGGGVYILEPTLSWDVDVVTFDRRIATGHDALRRGEAQEASRCWSAALALYRGPFLTGDDDPWVEEQRERLRQRRVGLLRAMGGLSERVGDLEGALDAYRLSLAEEGLQEDLHLALLRVYARQGRRDLVRRHFDRFSRTLAEELGVEPTLQATLEYHRLMGISEG